MLSLQAIPEPVRGNYQKRVKIARRNWNERIEAIKKQKELEEEKKRNQAEKELEEELRSEQVERGKAGRPQAQDNRVQKIELGENRKSGNDVLEDEFVPDLTRGEYVNDLLPWLIGSLLGVAISIGWFYFVVFFMIDNIGPLLSTAISIGLGIFIIFMTVKLIR